MSAYCELSNIFYAVTGFHAVLNTLFAVFMFVLICYLHMHKNILVYTGILTVISGFMMTGADAVSLREVELLEIHFFMYDVFDRMPWFLFEALLSLCSAFCIVLWLHISREKKKMLKPGAMKETLDVLPDGICFSREDGQPLLVNIRMNRLCSELIGSEMLNTQVFWEKLNRKKISGSNRILRMQPSVVVQLKDDSIWDFQRKTLKVDDYKVEEIIAYDVTTQYSLSMELESRNQRLVKMNDALIEFNHEVGRITKEKEILNAKIKVHDDVGRSLIAFRLYLTQKGDRESRERLLDMWRYTIKMLKNEAENERNGDDWEMLCQAAQEMSVIIERDGDLPDDAVISSILITVAHECLTNMLKHAGGRHLYLNLRYDGGLITAEFRNDGRSPDQTITETGGLKNLRYTVETAGGKMTVESLPVFLLRIEFQMGDGLNGKDQGDDR